MDKSLAGFQRRFLRGKAHSLRPAVEIGRAGISGAVIAEVKRALDDHELIKVRLQRPEDKKAMAAEIAARCAAHLCGLIGHQVILYRRHPTEPTIELPERDAEASC